MTEYIKVGQIEFGDVLETSEKANILASLESQGFEFCEDRDYNTSTYIIMKAIDAK